MCAALLAGLRDQLSDGTAGEYMEVRQGDRWVRFHRDVLKAMSPYLRGSTGIPRRGDPRGEEYAVLPDEFSFDHFLLIVGWWYGNPVRMPATAEDVMSVMCLMTFLDVPFEYDRLEDWALSFCDRDTCMEFGGLARLTSRPMERLRFEADVRAAERAARCGSGEEVVAAMGGSRYRLDHVRRVIDSACQLHGLPPRTLREALVEWHDEPFYPGRLGDDPGFNEWLRHLDKRIFAGRLALSRPFPKALSPPVKTGYAAQLTTTDDLCLLEVFDFEGGSRMLTRCPGLVDCVAPGVTPLSRVPSELYYISTPHRYFKRACTLTGYVRDLRFPDAPAAEKRALLVQWPHVYSFGADGRTVERYDGEGDAWESRRGVCKTGRDCRLLAMNGKIYVAGVFRDMNRSSKRMERKLQLSEWDPRSFEGGAPARVIFYRFLADHEAFSGMLPGPGGRVWIQLMTKTGPPSCLSVCPQTGFRTEPSDRILLDHNCGNPLLYSEAGLVSMPDHWVWDAAPGSVWNAHRGWERTGLRPAGNGGVLVAAPTGEPEGVEEVDPLGEPLPMDQ